MIRVRRKIVVRIIRFFVATVICILAFLGLRALSEMWKEGAVTQYPKKTLGVVIDLDQREKFFEQLRRFAEAHNFDIHIGPTTPAGNTFNINMTRKDVILIANNGLDLRGYDIAFYDKDPANPVSEEIIDSLLIDLKRFISEVPNIRIFEEQ